MEGNCGYFRRLLGFIFTKWSFLSLPKRFPQYSALIASQFALRKHNPRYWACARYPSMHFWACAEDWCTGIVNYGRSDVHSSDFSYFVVEHNLPAAIAGPFSSLARYVQRQWHACRRRQWFWRVASPWRDCPYYRPMSVLEWRWSRPDESRHRNTDKRLTVLARQTQITCVYFLL